MKPRIYFLDNLRTFLIFLVIVLHAGLVYETVLENSWIVSDPEKNSTIGLIRMYLDIFVMFAIFFISGYFIPASLKNKTTLAFIKSKFNRIIIPWIVSVFTLIPAYKAIFLHSRGLPQEEWFTYFHIFQRIDGNPYFFADNPVQNWLWFLPVLFVFQIAYLIIAKRNFFKINISLVGGVILTIIIGLIYSMVISGLNLKGWYHSAILHFQNERLLIYFLVFLLGSLCYKLKVFDSELSKKYYIISNVVLTLSISIYTVFALNLFFNMVDPGRNYYFISLFVDRSIYYFSMLTSMLSMIHVFVYTFKKYFNRSKIIMDQLNRNSYFVYIIHVIVIGIVAFFLLPVAMPVYIKFSIVVALTFVLSNAIVYIYRVSLQKILSTNIVKLSAVVIAAFLVTNIMIKQYNQTQITVNDNSEISIQEKPETGLHMAVIKGDLESVKQHIATGTDLNKMEPSGGSSPLITASLFGRTDIATELINAGADVNFINNEGSTPLHTASFFCHKEIVEALLAAGADKSITNNSGSTALDGVVAPFEAVQGIYNYFVNTLGPLGLTLDYEYIKKTRPVVADILK